MIKSKLAKPLSFLALLIFMSWIIPRHVSEAAPSSAPTLTGTAQTASSRRVNVWPTNGSISDAWAAASIFWFGRATDTENYVDVRVAYDNQALYVWATIVDYYLWYDGNGTSDPRTYDAIALYVDTLGNRSGAPQADDYFFASGYRGWIPGNDVQWRRQGRGVDGNWSESWTPPVAWTDSVGCRYYNSGPNDNSDLDAGWMTTLTIPWTTLGLTGPPASGSSWGLGVLLDDRDDHPPAGGIVPKTWPNGFSTTDLSTWGVLAFDPPKYQPTAAAVEGTTSIRRGLNGTVIDAYAGGGGLCGGGHFGGGDVPHPTDNLFVQNQADVADFPCFSKSYLRFDLSAIPADKTVISATLLIYEFGGSDPTQAQPSFIQLFSVADDWSEDTLTWNNAPLAKENLTAAWVYPLPQYPGTPGVAVTWDATDLVARAHANGQPASIVLYSADTAYHSGRYFVSSESGDWNADGRPTLIVTWGKAMASVPMNWHHLMLPSVWSNYR